VDGPVGVFQLGELGPERMLTFLMKGTGVEDMVMGLDDGDVQKVAVAVDGVLGDEVGEVSLFLFWRLHLT